MDNPHREFPKNDRVVPTLQRRYIPTNERRGWYLELIGCAFRRRWWHCVYSVEGEGRGAIGTVCRNSPRKIAICIWCDAEGVEDWAKFSVAVRIRDQYTSCNRHMANKERTMHILLPHVIFQLLHMSKHKTRMLRRLRYALRQHIPTTKPRLRILPHCQDKFTFRILLLNLRKVKCEWQIHRGGISCLGKQCEVGFSHDDIIAFDGFVKDGIDEMVEYLGMFIEMLRMLRMKEIFKNREINEICK